MIMMNCFFGMVDRRKTFNLIYSWDQILTIAILWHAVSRVWAYAKHEFKHSWMKLRSSDNHYIIFVNQRSSRLEVFCKKGVIRNFTKLTGKHLCQSLLFNKVAGLRPKAFIKKETLAQVFSCQFCDISKNTFFTEHLWATASRYVEWFKFS